jgi:hypothetical protein
LNIYKQEVVSEKNTWTHCLIETTIKQDGGGDTETVCTVAFFGFLRCGEFTIKSSFEPSTNLCVSDLRTSESCVDIKNWPI